jgi:hypothetical protein
VKRPTSPARSAQLALVAMLAAVAAGVTSDGPRAATAANNDAFIPFVTDFPKPVAPFIPFVTDFPKPKSAQAGKEQYR